MFKYYNCNPLKRQVNDCVVRAIALAENKSWNEVFTKLSKLAEKRCILIDDTEFVEWYLTENYDTYCFICNNEHLRIKEFLKLNPIGKYLITMKGHITCAIDGCVYDIWDCTNKRIWSVWRVEE